MKMTTKFPEKTRYECESEWDGKTGGVVRSTHQRTIVYDTPKTYGGHEEGICPDEMFVASVLACLNNTFLDFQRRFELDLCSLHLKGVAESEFKEGGYFITGISITGDVVVGKGELDTANRCVELMTEYCHLTRSIASCIPVEINVNVAEVD